jgi:diguanylate cyclase (GGDEF)-like protein
MLSLRGLIFASALCVCAALVVSYTVAIVHARRTAVAVARREAENLALSLSDQASDTFEAVNEILLMFSQRVKTLGTGSAARLELRDELAALVATMPRIHRLDVIDSRGRFFVSNISGTPEWLPSVKGRPYFRYHRSHTDPSVHISGPAESKTEKMWVVFVTRRIDNADGSFGGVLIAPIPFGYFEQTYTHVDVGRLGSISLLADDGTVMMREPPAFIAQSVANEQLFHKPYSYQQAGSYIEAAPGHGGTRLVAFRRLGRYPLVVAVALEESEYLHDWYADAVRSGLTVLAFLGFIAILAVGLDGQIRRSKRAESALERLALLDGLTSLANRRSFDDMLGRWWRGAARESRPLSLLMIDVDHFKRYNDHYGHPGGDAVLSSVARAIESVVRSTDIAARYGGEEFAVILPFTDTVSASAVANRVRAAIEDLGLPHAGNEAGVVTVSIGTATVVPRRSDDAAQGQLIAAADGALYDAKHAGRNRIAIAPPAPAAPAPHPAIARES